MKPRFFSVALLFYFLCISCHKAVGQCYRYDLWFPSTISTSNPGVLDVRYEVELQQFALLHNSIRYKYLSTLQDTLMGREQLSAYFDCISDFSFLPDHITFIVQTIELDVPLPHLGSKIRLVMIPTIKDIVIVGARGIFTFKSCESNSEVSVHTMRRQPLFNITRNIVLRRDSTVSITVENDVIFDTITELMLLREATYDLEFEPPVYDTVTLTYLLSETTTCPEADYWTPNNIIQTREASVEYISKVDSEFETVTEQILYMPSFPGKGAIYLGPTGEITRYQDESTFINISILGADSTNQLQFYNELSINSFNKIIDHQIDTMVVVYPNCPNGYQRLGEWCISEGDQVPAQYQTRTYEKLVKPTTPVSKEIPTEFTNAAVTRIRNKGLLPAHCIIDSTFRDYQLIRLVKPAKINQIPIGAIYEEVEILRYKSGAQIVSINGQPQDDILSYHKYIGGKPINVTIQIQPIDLPASEIFDLLSEKLIAMGYLNAVTQHHVYDIKTALAKMQLEHDLPLGVIDQDLFNYLQILY